ncbi:MAG: ketoacyl-ACP synthase III [Flavobacteriales bacterium CG_4_10_14_0_2_um_filter_32_8]|nr:MAG: ketoacyl-ACP synthase III [Flavobacteriales bacterium CG_4_10_14_0_2_um_filter_32_8]
MALFSIENIQIKGISCAVPKDIYSNMDYERISIKEREMLIRTTGVEKRHVAKFGTTTADLCKVATNKLLNELKWQRSDIEILIFVSQSRDYLIPATACILQNRLELSKNCMAFDVNMGCSGYVYGLSIIAGIMAATKLKKGLLLVGDVSTLNTSYKDKSTFPLFGDAGTCTAIQFVDGAQMDFNLQTDGSGYEAIIIRDGGCRNYASKESFDSKKYSDGIERNRVELELDGIQVFNFSLKEVHLNILTLLEFRKNKVEEIDYFIFHQANKLINESIRKKLKIPIEKFPYSMAEYGNTSSASIPLTILAALSENLQNQNQKLLLSGFGVGLSWGSAIIDFKNVVCLPIIEMD